ncbi:MAG: TVP38/TMEM64 family protein [Mariprofundaceae bacterium]|nr:TVP38/TMEM64 family protein [Mariprofundaceae bacterium]
MSVMKRVWPLVLLLAAAVLFFVFDLGRFLSFEALAEHRVALLEMVQQSPVLAALAYVVLYIAVVAFSLPGGAVMTISGGFLFGAVFGGLYAVIGATTGATILFLIAKTSLGDYLLAKAGPAVRRMQGGFAKDALSYLFVLRLIPVFPFFLVNLAPAFLGVPLRTYLIATFFGIMPGTFVYALAGAGLGSVFDQGGSFSMAGIMTPQMIGALIGLALLALLPVIYKRMKGKVIPEETP